MKNHKIAHNVTTTKASEKISTYLEFWWYFDVFWLNLRKMKFYLIKLATDFYWQPSYLLGERASMTTGRMKIGRIHKTYKFA